jgi:outer membrane protein TolC
LNSALEVATDDNKLTLSDQLLSAEQTMQSSMESFVTVARNIKKVELQQSMNDVNKEMIEDGLELSLMNYITQIRNTETQISLLTESVSLGQENIRNLEIKNSLGYESDTALASAKTTQQESESALKELKLTLKNEQQNLKTFLGLKADETVYIEYDPSEDNFVDNLALDAYITRKTNGDPSIRTLKNNVTMNEYIVRTNIVYESENKAGVQSDLATAQRALKDAQDNMEKKIRTSYNNVLQLQEMSKTYQRAITQAIADYNSALVSYNSGFATEYQVKQAKLGVINAEKNLDDNKLNIAMLEFQLEHPYLLQ